MQVEKVHIIDELRSRGQHDRADWVDRVLPEVVDTHKNGSLLRMLKIDLTAIVAPEASEGSRPGI